MNDISTPLVAAIGRAWAAIQSQNPDVPGVIVTIGAGSVPFGLKLGHFAPHRWVAGQTHVHELFIGGEGLERGAAAVMATLLHEAAHGAAVARDVQDVSRGGRYHNKRFKEIAESFGLIVTHSDTLGWSTSEISDATARSYARQISSLDRAIVAYRRQDAAMPLIPVGKGGPAPIGGRGRGRKSSNNGVSAVCACGRRIRVAQSVFDAAPITCGACGHPFTAAA